MNRPDIPYTSVSPARYNLRSHCQTPPTRLPKMVRLHVDSLLIGVYVVRLNVDSGLPCC